MKNNEIALDGIIKGLNKNKNISDIVLSNLENFDLTEAEKKVVMMFRPEECLIIYGTLGPNKPNHSKIEHIKGRWEKAILKGKLANKGWGAELGYYGFIHTSIAEQNEIEANVLFSDELVANWQLLDEFEGDGYKRILAKYELKNGEIGVGYVYAINENDN